MRGEERTGEERRGQERSVGMTYNNDKGPFLNANQVPGRHFNNPKTTGVLYVLSLSEC